MKMDIIKVKPAAGFFLEGLMLIFIFVYAQSDFTAEHTQDEVPLKSLMSLQQVAFISNPTSGTVSASISRHELSAGEVMLPAVDVPGLEIGSSDALSISQFERNDFYVLLTDHAP